MDVVIRQRVSLEAEGDRAEVCRILEHGGKLYVELQQTSDAREPTIMTAVNEALSKYEAGNGKEESQECVKENDQKSEEGIRG